MKLKTYNKSVDKFLKDLDYICQENAVQIIFTARSYVNCAGIKSSGYFDDDKRVLACALKTTGFSWLATLLHESCHLDQWRENSVIWQLNANHQMNEEDWLDTWLKGERELFNDQIEEMIKLTKELEWDCEKRTIEKIKKYKLKVINIEEYIKQSVIYIMFYDFVKKYRKWYGINHQPCTEENIYNLVSDKYDLNKLPLLTSEIEQAIIKYSFKGKIENATT